MRNDASYAAVIEALGAGQADVAWMPAFAYVIAHARYGAEVKLQVVRSVYHSSGEYPELVGVTLSGENGSAERGVGNETGIR